jgi:hypothetical protein
MHIVGFVAVACLFVAGAHGSVWQDRDWKADPCFDEERRICMTCDSDNKFDSEAACYGGGKREVCDMADSICWEQFEDGVYESGCKAASECSAGGNTKCVEGIVKPCGYDNWQNLPEYEFCENEYTVCEWKKQKFQWTCPAGQERQIRALWGRMAGDSVTCTEGVPGSISIDADCPGDEQTTITGLEHMCDGTTDSDGVCIVKAKIGGILQLINGSWKKYDPCVGVFKYLKLCINCIDPNAATTAPPTPSPVTKSPVLMLLDVSGSLLSLSTSYLPKVTAFLNDFFDATSSDDFFSAFKTELYVLPFDTGAREDEEWTLDYSAFASATELRNSERNGMADFIYNIESKEPASLTNIGQSLQDAFAKYSPDANWIVVVVSDFINMVEEPSVQDALQQYSDSGARVYPVFLDKPIRDADVYETVRSGTGTGIDTKDGVEDGQITAFYGP